jgi:hypothetical protein
MMRPNQRIVFCILAYADLDDASDMDWAALEAAHTR